MQRVGGPNESVMQILVKKLSESTYFHTGEGIHPSDRRFSTFFEFNLEVIRVMRWQSACAGLVENVLKLVIIF